jgi:hypothetical protein
MRLIDSCRRATDLMHALVQARELAAHDAWPRERLLAQQRAAFLQILRHAKAASAFSGLSHLIL